MLFLYLFVLQTNLYLLCGNYFGLIVLAFLFTEQILLIYIVHINLNALYLGQIKAKHNNTVQFMFWPVQNCP